MCQLYVYDGNLLVHWNMSRTLRNNKLVNRTFVKTATIIPLFLLVGFKTLLHNLNVTIRRRSSFIKKMADLRLNMDWVSKHRKYTNTLYLLCFGKPSKGRVSVYTGEGVELIYDILEKELIPAVWTVFLNFVIKLVLENTHFIQYSNFEMWSVNSSYLQIR